jgi:hypothetical protein
MRRHGTADGEETSSRDPVHEVGVTGNCTMSQVFIERVYMEGTSH